MSIKIKIDKNQASFAAKELQKFLHKVQGVMMIPKEKNMEYSILCLLLREEAYVGFKDYGINKHIVNLLDDKHPVLSIKIEKAGVRLSIIDQEFGLSFTLPEQPRCEGLLKFMQASNPNDYILLMIGVFQGDHIGIDPKLENNSLLVLDGYVFN